MQLVGKDSLAEEQKATLIVAKIIREEFLQQNAFSEHDKTCPLWKTIGMLKCICTFSEQCKLILEDSSGEKKMTMGTIEETFKATIINDLKRMKFILPELPQTETTKKLDDLSDKIESEFRTLAGR